MRKIVLELAVSLDGMIEGPAGEYDWCMVDPEIDFAGFLQSIDAILFGRKSYELFGSQAPEGASDAERSVMDQMYQKRKYVVSRSLPAVPEPDVLVQGDVIQQVQDLKRQPGKDIWLFGGASLTTTLMNAGLIDEYRLAVHPIVLGAGKPLFQNIQQRVGLKLANVKRYSCGVVHLFYRADHA